MRACRLRLSSKRCFLLFFSNADVVCRVVGVGRQCATSKAPASLLLSFAAQGRRDCPQAPRERKAQEAGTGEQAEGIVVAVEVFLFDVDGQQNNNSEQLSARPKRALGQNFVVDEEVLDRVTEAALARKKGSGGVGVLEVGPGTGNLTRRLLDFGGGGGAAPSSSSSSSSSPSSSGRLVVVSALTAVEKDDALAENLKSTLEVEEGGRLRIVHEDFLKVNLPVEIQALRERAAAFAAGDSSPPPPPSSPSSSSLSPSPPSPPPLLLPRAVVVANLPYNITSDALRILLPMGESISEVHLMLQDEAARRLAGAREGDPDWRGASALARYFSEPEVLFGIPARCFLPKPRVDSALVRFRLKRPEERLPRASDERLLRAVISAAFAQRRKALKNSLGALVGQQEAAAAIEAAGLDPSSARADAVSVGQFVTIANAIVEASDPAVLAAAAAAAAAVESRSDEEGEEEEDPGSLLLDER